MIALRHWTVVKFGGTSLGSRRALRRARAVVLASGSLIKAISMILLGLLPDHDHSRSILNVQLRDPGGNMLAGYRSRIRRSQMPLTRMAERAIAGTSGVDVEGYADYRGVPGREAKQEYEAREFGGGCRVQPL